MVSLNKLSLGQAVEPVVQFISRTHWPLLLPNVQLNAYTTEEQKGYFIQKALVCAKRNKRNKERKKANWPFENPESYLNRLCGKPGPPPFFPSFPPFGLAGVGWAG